MNAPTILWLRRDLRLADHPALAAAIGRGGAVIPVFIHDESVALLGAAPQWRLGLSLAALSRQFEDMGSRLVLRRGDALEVLRALVRQTGAKAVVWSRIYEPEAIARDKAVKAALTADGIVAQSHNSHLLFEPWTVATQQGGYYKVYSPMWRAVKDRDVPAPLAAPSAIPAPKTWPQGDLLEAWQMGRAMQPSAAICLPHQHVGEGAAQTRLDLFIAERVDAYRDDRNLPAVAGTSGLSENLTYGEISVRQCWHAGQRAHHEGAKGAEHWIKELVWREFAYHLMYHTPRILTDNWREKWRAFPWHEDARSAKVIAWQRGRTGVKFVDAAMREMYVTGKMHNRARMIVASYLTKHLMCHWRIGQAWFADCLTDWDPASNAMGWQWVAGSGPDASPYFRIFNPVTQLDKFDPDHHYVAKWIAEGHAQPAPEALSYFDAIPRHWGMSAKDSYPEEVVGMAEGRQRALAAYEGRGF